LPALLIYFEGDDHLDIIDLEEQIHQLLDQLKNIWIKMKQKHLQVEKLDQKDIPLVQDSIFELFDLRVHLEVMVIMVLEMLDYLVLLDKWVVIEVYQDFSMELILAMFKLI